MSGMHGRLAYRPLRAPQGDGEILIDPPLADCTGAIEQNLQHAGWRDVSVGGRSLGELSRAAREHLWQTALQHTRDYAPSDWQFPKAPPRRVYLVGHQPNLFHPGVWLKNFVSDRLAKRDGAAAIHVLIDNDVVTDGAIPVISGTPAAPRMKHVALDQSSEPTPWEERTILSKTMFASAAERIAEAISPFIERPLVEQLWGDMGESPSSSANFGQVIARARHRLELQWGLQTLEAPLSAICNGEPFRWFVAFVLSRLPQLHQSHNDALAEYRRTHRLRSRSHPVSDLTRSDDQFETPFWVWETTDPRRRKLFAEPAGDGLILSDAEGLSCKLPGPLGDDFSQAVDELTRLEASGVKIRPRALMTTMYLRVFLGDYFIHGIGGAKYDQITDCLIEDLFGIAPPAYMIVSGTRLLPVSRPATTKSDLDNLRRRLREIEFHPERFIGDAPTADEANQVDALVAEKRGLTQPNNNIDARDRHHSLVRINAELQKHVAHERDALLRQISQGESGLRAAQLLSGREFPFGIYPEAALRDWLLDADADAS